MESIDVLVMRPPRFYTDGVTANILPEEVLIPTVLEKNSVSSRFLNADFVKYNRKFTLYPKLDDYLFSQKRLKEFLKGKNKKWKYAKKNILKINPKIVILIPRSASDFSVTINTAKMIKEIDSDIRVGVYYHYPYTTYFIPSEFLKTKYIDLVVATEPLGEPEYTVLEVSKTLLDGGEISKVRGLFLRNKKGKVVFTGVGKLEFNLDNFPIPDRELIIDRKYYPPSSFGLIEGGRGCIYNCTFCSEPLRPFRLRSPKNVVKEIAQLYIRYGTRDFGFNMSSFLHSKKWAKEVCNLIKKFGLDITFSCYVNANQIDKETVKMLKSAGCRALDFGLESGDYTTLKKMNKISNLNLEKVKEAASIIKSHKIFFRTGIIIGSPGETLEQMKNSFKLLREVKPDFFRVQFFVPILSRSFLQLKSKKIVINKNLDEYHTGAINIKTNIDQRYLKKIWIKYAKLSDLADSIILRKSLFSPNFLRSKIVEYVKYLTSLVF